ncbi:pyrophosphate-energized vacuolar membrane proton pump-like [Aristolochia californica]|uniref:pyrophosphate-energized vacuolar membrane proton pump-like n=1 Tax=Aristolochia californica TaxID=171875 RepID=UPI0035DF1555
MHIYKQMPIVHVPVDLVTYTILLNAYCLAGSVVRAQDIYEEVRHMAAVGACKMHAITYITIIKVFVDATLWQLAWKIKEETVSDGVLPNVVTRSSLINAIAKADLEECAIHTADKMLLSGYDPSFKRQLLISTILMTVWIAIVSYIALPPNFTLYDFGVSKPVQNWHFFFCVAIGLWVGLLIGYTTKYYTSNTYSPMQDVANSYRTGAATNVIFGLALVYKFVIIPVFAIVVSIFVNFSLTAMYGIAVVALGMLSAIATGLAIDAYGPIIDKARGIVEMASMRHKIYERINTLDAAGTTTTAIGKGFAIGSAALVSLALLGAFVSRAKFFVGEVMTPKVFIGLNVGAMLPYWFSSMTMKSVGSAALQKKF